MGYSAIKLCVDEHGCQPLPFIHNNKNNQSNNSASEPVFLNAGQFVLPIYYGRIPSDNGPVSQVSPLYVVIIESRTHVHFHHAGSGGVNGPYRRRFSTREII